ncbi:hypothetical protein SAMN04488028_101689 [Reichenbachiella agariperforans]|uniref:HotDog ACOT-type domain-containing protein n=1 Tax=Reichenbachiella agariperforans TaxID=156994 RepID=A0A1M6KS65_REIAG|nr:hypothetical protein [Reichenbachiella agariperforans]SHJ61818.1 hypothetical protein SAMN04488028_101689 [Reichenbachiella agariperforans]
MELVGNVSHVGNTSMKVRVDIFVEQMYKNEREKAISGEFTFVAIDEDKKPVSILKNKKKTVSLSRDRFRV